MERHIMTLTIRDYKKLRFFLLSLIAPMLAACNSGSSGNQSAQACIEIGAYACQTGESEPLYTFQWALHYADSYFKDFPKVFNGGMDLNVESVHRQGIKGQGINVLVLDDGADLQNEDLAPNADFSMSWNFTTQNSDPYPDLTDPDAPGHGTIVAGIIGAAQNGKGVMGIAPLVKLGAANYLDAPTQIFTAYGGAPWSSKADIFNASFGAIKNATPYESDISDDTTTALRGIKKLRGGKGAVFIKSSGNSFDEGYCGTEVSYFDCTNPGNDINVLESNVITVAALNAMGTASSYSSAGSIMWVTGMGGEYGASGNYGEGVQGDGPTIFSTDVRGCIYGLSNTHAETPFLRGQTERNGQPDNPDCNYSYMNGTSSSAPSISGVAALILSANPALTWRDVRDILRASARKVDADYIHRIPRDGDKRYGALEDLTTNQPTDQMGSPADIHDGAVAFPMNLGWQKNAAGYEFSNRYGFGVPDAAKAVAIAQEYKNNPNLSRASDVHIPGFTEVAYWQSHPLTGTEVDFGNAKVRIGPFPYRRVTSLGTFKSGAQTVDQFQIRLSGIGVCLGSLGIAAKSPSGTVSIMKLPNDHFRAFGIKLFDDYGLGSFAFYGEPAAGDWEIFAIASNPVGQIPIYEWVKGQRVDRLSTPCPTTDGMDAPLDFKLFVDARIIAQ